MDYRVWVTGICAVLFGFKCYKVWVNEILGWK